MNRILATKAFSIYALGFCLLLLAGCGGEATYKVEGKIEFADGTPVMFGDIEFLNRERKLNARGKIKRDGTFTVSTFGRNDGAVEGQHEVTIQQFVTIPLAEHQVTTIHHDHGSLVHEKYRSYEKSDLTVTIERKSPNETVLVVEKMKGEK